MKENFRRTSGYKECRQRLKHNLTFLYEENFPFLSELEAAAPSPISALPAQAEESLCNCSVEARLRLQSSKLYSSYGPAHKSGLLDVIVLQCSTPKAEGGTYCMDY